MTLVDGRSVTLVEGIARIDDLGAVLDDLDGIADATGATVQAFDARYVVDRAHLERAVELADRAFARGESVARDRGVEITLYAAGRRQINRALEMGVSEGETRIVAVCVGGEDETAATQLRNLLEPAQTLGDYDRELVEEFFDVTDRELSATAGTFADVIHERVALLDVEK